MIPENILTAVKSILAPYGDYSGITAVGLESLIRPASPGPCELLTKKQAAEMLRCSPMTVFRLAKQGKIETYKRNSHAFAVSRASVVAYINSTKVD